ncbi:menaquinone biosynthesis protein [Flavihumibacter rivuli]|uniref:menaquinone biosynthetic enzyme MqnA/MqnD family protein n=1 Tax=Flavihumibacter rivuli TaxID=2838156 RepID=UPI001BDE70F7|nr:menaquinone biosynthesis protein [Flavihumibacter rivuli]ULQ57418.1 menaquinone biosynthesis protein [Flavihumibacter rivuli]
MERKIRVGAVNYLNTKPLIYGLEKGMMNESVELEMDYPAHVASKLLNNEIDMGLVPVATIPRLKEYYIIGTHCIGCSGPVASVCLFSEVPIEQVEKVLLDYQSRTSVRLAKILMKHYWKIDPVIEDTKEDFRNRINGTTAGVVIGDRALEQRHHSPYIYDLGEAWINFTGLPFVFAAWISNKPLDPKFIEAFDQANTVGFQHLEEIVAAHPFPYFNLKEYYTRSIDYKLDERKKAGLQLYLEYLEKMDL